MKEVSQSRKMLRPLLLGGAVALLTIATLIIWAGNRHTAADRVIRQKLAALRASGEPITAEDVARMFAFPPPEQDARILFSNALEFAALNRPPYGLTPLIGLPPLSGHNSAMNEQSISALRTYFADTAAIADVLPTVPPGARFGTHWEVEILNASPVPFVKVRSLIQLL